MILAVDILKFRTT